MSVMIVRHVHSSSRFDRTPGSLWRALRIYMASFFGLCNLTTFTEMSNNKRAKMLRWLGWGTVQIEDPDRPGADECAGMYSKWVWELFSAQAVVPCGIRMRTRGGQYNYVLVMVLKHKRTGEYLVVYVVHLPAHLHFEVQMKVWEQTVQWLGANADRDNSEGHAVMVTGDWNKNFNNRKEVASIKEQFSADFRLNWQVMPSNLGTGPGGDLIDGTVTNMEVVSAKVMPANDSSDHRPFKEVLSR